VAWPRAPQLTAAAKAGSESKPEQGSNALCATECTPGAALRLIHKDRPDLNSSFHPEDWECADRMTFVIAERRNRVAGVGGES
jgi:hypothetical protein